MTRFFTLKATAILTAILALKAITVLGQVAQKDTLTKPQVPHLEFEADSIFRPNGLFFNLTQLCIGEINFEYENFIFKNSPRLSMNVAMGYRFIRMNGLDENIGTVANNGWADLWGYFWSQSFYASASTKIYKTNQTENKQPYIECVLFFRDNFFNKVLVHYGKQHDDGINVDDRLQSSNEKVYGVKCIAGTKKYYSNIGRIVFSKNWFLGFGIRVKYISKTTFEESPNPAFPAYGSTYIYNPPKHENYSTLLPLSLQGGLKLGWDWKKK